VLLNPHAVLPAGTRRSLGAASVILLLVVWSAMSATEVVPISWLPTPWSVAESLIRLAWDPDQGDSPLATAIAYSVGRILLATTALILVGVPVGVLMGTSPTVNAFLSPLVDPLKSAPIVAVMPILMIWLGIDEGMKVAFLWLGAIVYLVPMVRDAIKAVPQEYVILSYDLGATPWETVVHTLVPLATPRIFDALIVSIGIEWTYITVAEYVGADAGLGYIVQTARKISAMGTIFAGIFVILVLSYLTDTALRRIKVALFPWETES
jgi:ABC-type nitrate/sulfonate/bicarbonate transport system permease component